MVGSPLWSNGSLPCFIPFSRAGSEFTRHGVAECICVCVQEFRKVSGRSRPGLFQTHSLLVVGLGSGQQLQVLTPTLLGVAPRSRPYAHQTGPQFALESLSVTLAKVTEIMTLLVPRRGQAIRSELTLPAQVAWRHCRHHHLSGLDAGLTERLLLSSCTWEYYSGLYASSLHSCNEVTHETQAPCQVLWRH